MTNHSDSGPEQEPDDNLPTDASREPEETESSGDEPVSRSQRKREATDITRLGQTISELSENDLNKLPLDERSRTAVDELRRIRSFGARKRQLLYLGKVLRKADLEPIYAALTAIQLSASAETRLLHAMEQWRDRILGEGDIAIEDFLQQYTGADRQRLRQIVRKHKREIEQSGSAAGSDPGTSGQTTGSTRASKSSREMFKLIRAAMTDADTQ